MAHKKRTYEVSVWTLQDEFISVLKVSNIENKGQIEEPNFRRLDDGTEEFSFSIPMYFYEGKERVPNPIWYDVKKGALPEDMRKIKVTFNKGTKYAKTFEFVITEIEEDHNTDKLYYKVTCSGLAFHELGKRGYKISLTAEGFQDEDYQYFIGESMIQPHATLNYWMDKILPYLPSKGYIDPAQWYYKIEMDWSSFQGDREKNKVYEDPYVKSWEVINSKYVPTAIENTREKERMVDINESNLYNITQDLSKAFGVFCRYEYEHDEHLNIIKRVVVFYNNYMREKEGYIDLTYPYSTSAITRNRDSNDLSTKMFVKPVDDESSLSGQITILDVAANKMQEDYLFNFDYLLKRGNITAEQEEEINNFQVKIGNRNTQLKAIENPLMALHNKVPELEAKVTIHTNSIQLDKEQLNAANDLLNELTDGTGELEVTSANPKTAVLLKSSVIINEVQTYYINLTDKGILPETVKLYYGYDFVKKEFLKEITSAKPEYDEFNNLVRISEIVKDEDGSSTVYLTYKYIPQLCYDNVRKVWEARLNKDEIELEKVKNRLETTNKRIKLLEEQYDSILKQKNKEVAAFEKMMGPAIRESYWQPEDYTDYGNNYIDNFTITTSSTQSTNGDSMLSRFLWDSRIIDDELEFTGYETGVEQELCGYPVIDLSGHEDYLKDNYDKISFMFYDFKHESMLEDEDARTPKNMRVFSAGSTAQYGFVTVGSTIKPVLVITGFETLSDDSRKKLADNAYSPTVGIIKTNINGININTFIESGNWTPTFLNNEGNGVFTPIQLYYPRIEIKSLQLKIDNTLFAIKYNNKLLENYADYYLLMRDNSEWSNNDLITGESFYYATIKPEAILAQGGAGKSIEIKFNISNADIAIYLDAIKVLEENSQPKVSYTIEPSVVDEEFLYTLYNKLCRVCNINDTELKFDNVQGYISEVSLDCDNPQNDSIEIKNYKTKFEDLFSSIVAQTESMQKNAYALDLVKDSFPGGQLSGDVIQNTIDDFDIKYSFNDGKLTLDEKDGICGLSDSGIIAIRNDGIFTAAQKDESGNWKWNSAILPTGINANLIVAGQLDTNRIKIYSGDKVRFQLNGDGLFAYKSFFEDMKNYNLTKEQREKIEAAATRINDIDTAQYVVMNENGLFLWGKKDALVLNKNKDDYVQLNSDVARVEVSWEGFKLRNWDNEEVFYADPDTGNLVVKGTIYASNLFIGENNREFDGHTLTGTCFSVDADEGEVQIFANKQMQLQTNGILSISGSSGVKIGSDSFIRIEGAEDDLIKPYVQIDKDGIQVTGKTIKLNGIGTPKGNFSPKGGEIVEIEGQETLLSSNSRSGQKTYTTIELSGKNGIDMQTTGNVKLSGISGSIEFLDNEGNVAFSVDPQGVITCKKIICTGDIVGVNNTPQPSQTDEYVLVLAEGAQEFSGATAHSRNSIFSLLQSTSLLSGQYELTELNLTIKTPTGFVNNQAKVSIIINETTIINQQVITNWEENQSKTISLSNQQIQLGSFADNFNKIIVTTIINYTGSGGHNPTMYSTEWDLTVTNSIKIKKITSI